MKHFGRVNSSYYQVRLYSDFSLIFDCFMLFYDCFLTVLCCVLLFSDCFLTVFFDCFVPFILSEPGRRDLG